MSESYQINEKDIESMINYLKTKNPELATPEMAIAMLEELQVRVHLLAHENPALLEEIDASSKCIAASLLPL